MSRAKKTKEQPPTPPPTLSGTVKSLVELLRRSNCPRPRQYVAELAWLFFLRFVDDGQMREAAEAEERGLPFVPVLAEPYRWRDWAAPEAAPRQGKKTKVLKFVEQTLVPALKAVAEQPDATARQKTIGAMATLVERSRIDSEAALNEVLDAVHAIGREATDDTQLFTLNPEIFTLTQVFEEMLLKLSGRASDGGQVPREVVQAMLRVIDPQIGKTIYDPECGTGGFLVESFGVLASQTGAEGSAPDLEVLRRHTFHGWENNETLYCIALTNLVLHGIDESLLSPQDASAVAAATEGSGEDEPEFFDYVLSNPSTDLKELPADGLIPDEYNPLAQLFQHMLLRTRAGSRCGLVFEDRVLRDTRSLAAAKQRLLQECDVYCIVRLPESVFPSSEANGDGGMNLVFFENGRPTERIWYYDMPELPGGKKAPLSLAHFDEFFALLPERADGERSWSVDFAAQRAASLQEAHPYREAADAAAAELRTIEAEIAAVQPTEPSDLPNEALTALEEPRVVALRKVRETEAQAAEIEHPVYNLLAANPHQEARQVAEEENDRRMVDLITKLEEQSRVVDDALARVLAIIRGSNHE